MTVYVSNPLQEAPSFQFSVPHEVSVTMDADDLEVEDILNELGIFADGDYGLFDKQVEASIFAPQTVSSSFAPVSPDHRDVSPETTTSEFRITTSPPSPAKISPSISMEKLEIFSVPNPIFNPISPPESPKKTPELPYVDLKDESVLPTAVQSSTVSAETSVGQESADSKSRKRKLSIASLPDSELTEQQMQERRQRNREHAKRSRLRKKSLTVTLQQSMEELKAENKKLRTQIYSMIGQEKAESILTARKTRSDERFLSGLQDPKNRIVDDSTIAFLKSLQKQIK